MTTPAWRPDIYAKRRDNLRLRAKVLQAVRAFFVAQDFLEVETPILQISPGLEPHLQAFATTLEGPRGETRELHLHTSPEFGMKKLLVAGEEKIFQMARVFRNGERSPTHHPEFLMLEWYRAGADYTAVMRDTIALVRAATRAAGRQQLSWHGIDCDPFAEWQKLTVQEAFVQYAGIDMLATAVPTTAPEPDLLAAEARRVGVRVAEGDRWDDIFFRIFLERIEPQLGLASPCILYDYPLSMAALSRPKPGDDRLAERVEVYIAGLELANGFSELTDAAVQSARFEADMALKEQLYGYRYPIDADFLAALAHGMPASAGIALGLDRLIMALAGVADITDILWLPVAGTGIS
jgi:lysyl-tRNA synthetase class 2